MLIILISCLASKGRSHMILRRIPNRDQNREGDEESKETTLESPMFDSKIKSLKDEIDALKEAIETKDKKIEEQEDYTDLLSSLYDKGIIDVDEDGNILEQD